MRLARDIGVEERAADDVERQLRHLRVHVHDVPIPPGGLRPRGGRREHLRVAGHPAAVEERLHQPTLPKVQLALAREQPLTEHALRHLQRLTLHERSLLADQHLPDQIRMVQEDLALGSETEARDVAVLPGDTEERPGRVPPERERERAGNAWPRARWEGVGQPPHRTRETSGCPAPSGEESNAA